jgi:hypothetical protein
MLVNQAFELMAAFERRAEKAVAPVSPGKIFRPDGTRQVSVNH